MVREIRQIHGQIQATVDVPGSKSFTNRALICAALAQGESIITNASDSDDTGLMANGLNQLGVLVRRDGTTLRVSGTGGTLYAPRFPIPAGNAGTTFRFLLSFAGIARGTTQFDVSERMLQRPLEDLLDGLGQLGVQVELRGGRYLVRGGAFEGGEITLQAKKSSQFVSSLLMVLPYARRDSIVKLVGSISSASYIDMTLDVMRAFGVEAKRTHAESFSVAAGQRYKPVSYEVETDASGATYFLAAAAVCGGEIFIGGLKRKSVHGDAAFIDILERMGCTIVESDSGITLRSTGQLSGVEVDMNSMPDAVPTLAATALFASSSTRITNIAHLRHKESDRLAALEGELKKLGADIESNVDTLTIRPAVLHGAQLDTYDDHRLAMSFALAGLRVQGVRIENPQCVKKSFPNFWREFDKLSTT